MTAPPLLPMPGQETPVAPFAFDASAFEYWLRRTLPPAFLTPEMLTMMIKEPARFAEIMDQLQLPPPQPQELEEAAIEQEDLRLAADTGKEPGEADVPKDRVVPPLDAQQRAGQEYKTSQAAGRNRGAYEEESGQLVPDASKQMPEPPAILGGVNDLIGGLSDLSARSVYEGLYVGDQGPQAPGPDLVAPLGDLSITRLEDMPTARVLAISQGLPGAMSPDWTPEVIARKRQAADFNLMLRALNNDPELAKHPELMAEYRQRAEVVGGPPTEAAEVPPTDAVEVPASPAPVVPPTVAPAVPPVEAPVDASGGPELLAALGLGAGPGPGVGANAPAGAPAGPAVVQALMDAISGVQAPAPVDVPIPATPATPQPTQNAPTGALAELLAALISRAQLTSVSGSL